MIKKKNKAKVYFVSCDKSVFVGNRYLCIKDVKMLFDNRLVFTEGKIYKSKHHDCLIDDEGDAGHQVSGFNPGNSFLVEHFKLMIVP